MKNNWLAIFVAGIWIVISEFIRNEFLLKKYWVEHFSDQGRVFETIPINGIMWVVWSFIFAYFLFALLQKFDCKKVIWLSWLVGFVMMWITAFNLGVLPLTLLYFAVPLSLLEVFIAVILIRSLAKTVFAEVKE